jgi:putative ABC transport system permease protein
MFALLPALHATRLTLTAALRGEIGDGVRGSTLRNFLVTSQVAVSLVLLVAAATLVRNGSSLASTDLGLDTTAVISVNQREKGDNLIPRAAALLASEPRVARVAATSRNPLLGELPKLPLRASEADHLVATSYLYVSPEYFETVRIPIVRGRGFSADEGRSEAKVGIISAAAARVLWPGADPLGKTIMVWNEPEVRPDFITRQNLVSSADVARQSSAVLIVGVARDAISGLIYEGRDAAHLYLPTSPDGPHAKSLLVRARSLHDLRPDALQTLLQKVHPNLLAFETLTLDEALALQMFPLMVASWIGLVLSGIALALSVSGLYGVVSYSLSQRTKEIGIRMALGATSAGVVRLLMTQSARLVAIGAGAGLAASFALMAILRTFVRLENVSVLDAGAFAASAALIGAAAALATYLPARRAALIEPSRTLRGDG